ncbi:hypothetical protein D4Q80_05040 [bacterium]|nr:MAG: hypothetical protein D4Q80_05040 [bacterium]
MEPKTFAFILHSRSVEELKKSYPLFRMVPDFILKRSFRAIAPFKVSQVKHVRSIRDKEIRGFFIDCPLLYEAGQEIEERLAFGKIFSAANLARRMGAQILGTDGCTSLFKDGGETVAKHLYMPFTNGNALTAWTVLEAVYRTAKVKGVDLKSSTVAVIDAASPLANLCARKIAEYAARIILCGSEQDKLEILKEKILSLNSIEATIEDNASRAMREAAIIVIAGSGLKEVPENLEAGKIICYVSLAQEMVDKLEIRDDITGVEAGLIKLPYSVDLQLNLGLPKDLVSAPLAETMLLALEERFVSYSGGENINLDKVEEIADIAAKHGFEVWVPDAPLL